MRKPDLSKLHFTSGPAVPTMIVPPGTQILVDPQGQVSIRTPGNLVLQNSGAYATLESVSGSIRIEPSVHVEAVTVRCADTCLVQGSLTAWRPSRLRPFHPASKTTFWPITPTSAFPLLPNPTLRAGERCRPTLQLFVPCPPATSLCLIQPTAQMKMPRIIPHSDRSICI